jgi:hypothetical protein
MVTDQPISVGKYTLYPKATTKTITEKTVDLYTCLKSPPPSRLEPGLEMLPVSIKWDTEIDVSTLPVYVNPIGEEFYRLDYEVRMTCVGGTLDFACYFNGERQGSVNVVADCNVGIELP